MALHVRSSSFLTTPSPSSYIQTLRHIRDVIVISRKQRVSTKPSLHRPLPAFTCSRVTASVPFSSAIAMSYEEWKTRAPYRIHEPNDNFKARYDASCHCGRVTYQLSREKPLDVKYCHCTTCQTLHGAPFQWAAIFHKDDINFTNGHHDLVWYDSGEKTTRHKLPCKVSCAYCRTPIMDEGRNMILLFPSLIHFKGDRGDIQNFEPSCHMFYGRRVVDIMDGKPKWSGLNNDSELMDENEHLFGGIREETASKALKDNKRTSGNEKREPSQRNDTSKRAKINND